MTKTYRVMNPRNIPKGRHILSLKDGTRFYEGDTFDPPKGCDLKRLLRDGFIKETGGGQGKGVTSRG